MTMHKPPQILCMRLADMHRIHPDQDNTRVCARCGHTVGIYPSGQKMLRKFPTLEIVCQRCSPNFTGILAPGAINEPSESHDA